MTWPVPRIAALGLAAEAGIAQAPADPADRRDGRVIAGTSKMQDREAAFYAERIDD